MHYHLEIILPPSTQIEDDIKSILAPFDENSEDARHPFWDFYSIGGRWSGKKLRAGLDPDKLKAFHNWLVDEKITVSSVIFGKEELSPSTQIPKVDAKWREMFPNTTPHCPFFSHASEQFNKKVKGTLLGDIQELKDVSPSLKCSHLIIAAPSWVEKNNWTGPCEAVFMTQDSIWNGVTHVQSTWNGTISQALELNQRNHKGYNPDYLKVITPQPNWLVVTIDYHS